MNEPVLVKKGLVLGGGSAETLFNTNSYGDQLRQEFRKRGYDLAANASPVDKNIVFELHFNARAAHGKRPAYVILFETPLITKRNGDPVCLAQYRKLFTWNDSLVDGSRFIKLQLPNPVRYTAPDGYASRPDFCCIIASNKSMASADPRELYSERVRVIRWFETHAPQDFALYGGGWNLPVRRFGWGRTTVKRFWMLVSHFYKLHPFPSYRGRIPDKHDALLKTRFSFCYENVRDFPGYVTEKIFDCMFAGCVPVYWGANNVTDYIPADCFIDRRRFRDTAEVYAFLKAMPETEYRGYQQRMADFLTSERMTPFTSGAQVCLIADTIAQDLARLHE